jgi:hypothetical protein
MAQAVMILRDDAIFQQVLKLAEKAGKEPNAIIHYWQVQEVLRLWEESISIEVVKIPDQETDFYIV